MKTSFRRVVWFVSLCCFLMIGGPVRGEVLDLALETAPDILSGFIDVSYDAGSDTLTAVGFALELNDDDVGASLPIVNGSFVLVAPIDGLGVLGAGGTLTIGGTVAALGFNSGTLLTGSVTDFGFRPEGGDPLEFLFEVTGGDAAALYGSAPGGVVLAGTGFSGSFAADFGNLIDGASGTGAAVADVAPERRRCRCTVDINLGSLLVYSKVELKWDAAGNLIQDTFLDIANDYPKDVFVQLYFVNGDEPLNAVHQGDPPVLVERAHPGWNWADCQILLTNDQPMYWSAATGVPLGCQPFTVLDTGNPPGRPDLDGPPGSRILRGFVYAWAVDQFGEEISWNRLKGDALVVNYATVTAWEYNAYAFQAACAEQGEPTDDVPGQLLLDGAEYCSSFDRLLLDFYASGSRAFSTGELIASVHTDLTLFPVSADLRQETAGPVVTKAKFDIWNMNEIRFSGTTRCIACWDQTLLAQYGTPNNFLLANLHTNKGKARIDGIASANVCGVHSVDASLLGIAKKMIGFSGTGSGTAESAMTLVGMGVEHATIRYDLVEPPSVPVGGLENDSYGPESPGKVTGVRSKRQRK